MSNHKCKRIDYCTCDTTALEPNESCSIHGHGEYPLRCIQCGRFMKAVDTPGNTDEQEREVPEHVG